MNNYRICKNKYGFYKTQMWKKPYKIFGIFKIMGEWVDCGFQGISSNCKKFETREDAQKQIDVYIKNDMSRNNEWKCDGQLL